MADKLKMVKGAFPEKMEVWLVTEHVTYIKEFEEVFHRKVRYIKDLNDLVLAAEQSPRYPVEGYTEPCVYASVIFYKALPSDVVSDLTNVLMVLDVVEKLAVYEVGRDDQVYSSSYVYGSLNQLEKDYKGLDRSDYINDLPDEDKQKRVLEGLDLEVNRLKEALTAREEEYVRLTKKYKELQKKNNDLQASMDTEVNVHSKEREKELEDVRRQLRDVRDSLDLSHKSLLNSRQKVKELEEKNFDLTYTKEALNNQITRLKDELQLSSEEYTSLEEDYRVLQEERADLLLKTSDGEKVEVILNDLDRVRRELESTEKELRNTRVLFREEEIRNKELEQVIEMQRRGHITEEVMGRTAILDHMELHNTDLVYIKVVDSLPYHRSAVKSLFEKIDAKYNGKARMAIISYDDGFDKYRYDGINVYRSLDDVSIQDKYFRLSPNTSMFTGGREYEDKIELLFIMDYTGGNDYLVKTDSMSNIMTMVRYAGMMNDAKLGLRGNPLTIGVESIYDLTYDSHIAGAGIEKTRKRYIDKKTEDWMQRLNLRDIIR